MYLCLRTNYLLGEPLVRPFQPGPDWNNSMLRVVTYYEEFVNFEQEAHGIDSEVEGE